MKPVYYQQQLLEQIGNRLYTIRHTKREKIITVAKDVGVSHPVISKIENGRYKGLSVDLLCKIASHYEINVERILVGDLPIGDGPATEIITMLKEENKYLKERLDWFLNQPK